MKSYRLWLEAVAATPGDSKAPAATAAGRVQVVALQPTAQGYQVTLEGKTWTVKVEGRPPYLHLELEGLTLPVIVRPSGESGVALYTPWEDLTASLEPLPGPDPDDRPGSASPARSTRPGTSATAAPQTSGGRTGTCRVTAPLPGTVIATPVEAGQQVDPGQVVAVLEAMKMENELRSPCGGLVEQVCVAVGQSVESGEVLVKVVGG